MLDTIMDRPKAADSEPANLRVIRDPEFAKRLDQACDAHSTVPPKHSGRLTWVKRELESRFDLSVSVETVRKWFAGETRPHPDKMVKLAELLQVDVAWLSLGIDAALEPRERRARNAMADGAVNVVAGLIQMDGGHPAFPTDSTKDHVDLHAIIRGAKYDLHVSLGEADGDSIRFSAPTSYEDMVVLGVVKRGFHMEVFDIPPELVEQGDRRGGSIEVIMSEAQARKSRIESFSHRL